MPLDGFMSSGASQKKKNESVRVIKKIHNMVTIDTIRQPPPLALATVALPNPPHMRRMLTQIMRMECASSIMKVAPVKLSVNALANLLGSHPLLITVTPCLTNTVRPS